MPYCQSLNSPKKVRRITLIIKEYQARLREMPNVPKTSYRLDSLGYCGNANKLFLAILFSDHAIGIHFIKDVGLIRSKVQCNSCGRDMTSYADTSLLYGFRWRYRKVMAGTWCFGSRSVRHGSWLQGSNINLQEVSYLTYDIHDFQLFIPGKRRHLTNQVRAHSPSTALPPPCFSLRVLTSRI